MIWSLHRIQWMIRAFVHECPRVFCSFKVERIPVTFGHSAWKKASDAERSHRSMIARCQKQTDRASFCQSQNPSTFLDSCTQDVFIFEFFFSRFTARPAWLLVWCGGSPLRAHRGDSFARFAFSNPRPLIFGVFGKPEDFLFFWFFCWDPWHLMEFSTCLSLGYS